MFLAWSIIAGNFRPITATMELYNVKYHLEHVKDNYWVLVVPNQIRVEAYRNIINSIKHLDPIEVKSDSDYVKQKLGGRSYNGDSEKYRKIQ